MESGDGVRGDQLAFSPSLRHCLNTSRFGCQRNPIRVSYLVLAVPRFLTGPDAPPLQRTVLDLLPNLEIAS